MRIAVNTRFLLSGRLEGLGWYTHELVRRMVLAHPEDEFVFLFDRQFDPAFVYADNVKPVVVFPPARHPMLWYLWFEWALPGVLKREKADVFFSPDSYLSLRTHVPTVMTVHDLIPLQQPEQVPAWPRYYYRYFLPRFLHKAAALVAVSGYTARQIEEVGGVRPKKIHVVYNGCREGFGPLAERVQQQVRERYAAGQPYFLYTGAIHPRKNIPRLIRSFDLFRSRTDTPVKLLLAGRFAWQTGAVRSAWEQALNKTDIHFLGYVADTELQQLMGAAIALVNISQSEGFGLPVAEAFHSEIPVVCSNTTALSEVAGDAALQVDPMSEMAVAEAMRQILRDPDLRSGLVEKGRNRRTGFNWDLAAESVYRILIRQVNT
ncbi:MAG: glycosyltransferase family 1 protein [Bacteroidetes bacterium]|nr:MAG: glycosyltransferase family 1 protein [Bacteroidota bacterium]